ncbi:hypothetical protein [Clostridium botulinum]|uniref:hypothetical protein n=1 Tax=Clostridium botulinum TaxID=1491 RepID=UPI000B1F867B|nr:hypothetical protein [Clostridium botulinum]
MMYTFDVVKLPAMDVASIQMKNPNSEADSLDKVIDFIISNNMNESYIKLLIRIKKGENYNEPKSF